MLKPSVLESKVLENIARYCIGSQWIIMLKNAWNNIVFSTSCLNAWTWLINKTDEKVEFASYSGVELTVKYEPNILPLPAMISVLLYSRAERERYWTFPLHRKVLVTRPKNYSEEDIDTSSWTHRLNCIFVPTLPLKGMATFGAHENVLQKLPSPLMVMLVMISFCDEL